MIKFIKTREVKTPNRGTNKSSGIDFFIPDELNYIIEPGCNMLIPLGIKVIIPDGYDLTFVNKSSIASQRNLIVGACLIDNDYRGELVLDLHNIGTERQIIKKGDKIIQGVIRKIEYFELNHISNQEFDNNETQRGEGGFGSTGNT